MSVRLNKKQENEAAQLLQSLVPRVKKKYLRFLGFTKAVQEFKGLASIDEYFIHRQRHLFWLSMTFNVFPLKTSRSSSDNQIAFTDESIFYGFFWWYSVWSRQPQMQNEDDHHCITGLFSKQWNNLNLYTNSEVKNQ